MKHNEIEDLLEKRRMGVLTDEELIYLNTLSRRDEVLTAAVGRADAIVRRRRNSVMAFIAIAAVAVGAMMLFAPQRDDIPQVAMQTAPMPMVEEPQQMSMESIVEPEPVQMAAVKSAVHKASKPAVKSDEPVVMCNSQCDADSVISDIWKFLSA